MSTESETIDQIKEQIAANPIILYMKGSPTAPQCGFSARTVQALMACGQRFAYVDVLTNSDVRQHLPKIGHWPTFPQLWIAGELIGGCDIVTDLHTKGELKPLVVAAVAK
ncbi:MAG: Grx4 family monothiol glutaredoxin [Cellvibrionales bacterium]|nr:Grx4 family monothiol glutaredoxin [Cellvibrionales bacterium]